MSAPSDATHMARALELAAFGPVADPNPRVGAVLVDVAGQVVGEGAHRGAGTPHAETEALAAAGPAARGATAYVTLEPCDHTGRTGPCSQALILAGVARVVYAQADPNPVARGGAQRLRAAGISLTGGVLADQASALNRAWAFAITRGRPWVTWKYAATLDGFSAAADGTSQWITSAAARADVHALRAQCGAVLVGAATVAADNPRLTARRPDGTLRPRQPLRAVMGLRELPAGAAVLDDAAPTVLLRTRDPHEALAALADRQIRRVWLEGGPRLAAAFLRADLIDEVVAYLAPALLGAGRPAMADFGAGTLGQARRLRVAEIRGVGPDVRVTAQPIEQEAS